MAQQNNEKADKEAAIPIELTPEELFLKTQSLKTFDPTKVKAEKSKEYPANGLLQLIQELPFLNHILDSSAGAGRMFLTLAKVQGDVVAATAPAQKAMMGLEGVHVALSVGNFIRLPLLFLMSAALGRPLPLKVSNLAKFLYSAVGLGLGIAALVVPIAAPFIGIAAAGLGVIAGTVSLFKQIYKKRQLQKALKAKGALKVVNPDGSESEESKANAGTEIYVQGELLRTLAQRINAYKENVFDSEGKIKSPHLVASFQDQVKNFEQEEKKLSVLMRERNDIQTELDAQTNAKLIGKSVGVILGSIALAGAVTALFFPPIGLALIGTSIAAGLAYAVVSIAIPKIRSRFFPPKEPMKVQNMSESKGEELEVHLMHDSTLSMGTLLNQNNPEKTRLSLQNMAKGVGENNELEAEELLLNKNSNIEDKILDPQIILNYDNAHQPVEDVPIQGNEFAPGKYPEPVPPTFKNDSDEEEDDESLNDLIKKYSNAAKEGFNNTKTSKLEEEDDSEGEGDKEGEPHP